MSEKIQILAVLGPTASGKTGLGIRLARRFGGEIVSCDSMQIYKGLSVGTARPSAEELSAAAHHLTGFLDPWQPFSVSDYVSLAGEAIEQTAARGKLPILVGGTGLYARSLLRGFSFDEQARDEALRAELFRRAEQEGPEALHRQLAELDPVSAGEIHPNNVKRVIRALEYCLLCGGPFSDQALRSKSAEAPYRSLQLCLAFRERRNLYDRIDRRVDRMFADGLLEEARSFFEACEENGVPPTAAQAIGYKELFPFFRGQCSLEEAADNLKRETRRYAKRQTTWFSREPDAVFLYVDDFPDEDSLTAEAVRLAEAFLRTAQEGGTAK